MFDRDSQVNDHYRVLYHPYQISSKNAAKHLDITHLVCKLSKNTRRAHLKNFNSRHCTKYIDNILQNFQYKNRKLTEKIPKDRLFYRILRRTTQINTNITGTVSTFDLLGGPPETLV